MVTIDDFKNIDPPKNERDKISVNKNVVSQNQSSDIISIDIFRRINLRIAKIISAEPITGSEKLLKLQVSLGNEVRQIIAGIAKIYTPQELVGREIVIVANLEPRILMGEESNGMLLAATDENGLPVILVPEKEVEPGSQIH